MTKGCMMIVDDESIIRMDLKHILIQAGYTVVAEANNGASAIELAAQHKPDLILMDVKMPRMNGIKASRIIQQSFHIPILLLTAYSQQEIIEEAKKANIIGYLVKPVNEKHVIPAIEIALEQAKRYKYLQIEITHLEEKIETRKLIEKAKGILMEIYHISEEEAFKRMRNYSMVHQKRMKEVASYVLRARELELSSRISSF